MSDADQELLIQRLHRCDREIADAVDESRRIHTAIEHVGILIWELDWRSERESILAQIGTIADR